MDNRWLLLFIFLIIRFCSCRKTIFKCCSFDETYLTDSRSGFAGCVKTNATWAPLVYSQRLQSFLPKEDHPSDWVFQASTTPICEDGFTLKLVQSHPNALPGFLLFDNGSLWLPEEFVDPGKYCVDFTSAFVCADEKRNISVKKCCGIGGVYSEEVEACATVEPNSSFAITLPQEFVFSAGFPVCPTKINDAHFVIAEKIQLYDIVNLIKQNGSLQVKDTLFHPGDYCLEQVLELGPELVQVFICAPDEVNTHKTILPDYFDIRFTLYPIGLFLSVFFLAATLAVGFLLPASLHQLHWRCQTGHVASLLIGDLLLAITQVGGHKITGDVCAAFAILMHFFFLAAFFWLNTMCFNIWWTFRDIRPANLDKVQESCRFRIYAVYACGFPLFIATLAAVFDNLPESYDNIVLRPRFAENKCWFYGDMEILLYFFIPVGVLLLINLLFFLATARELTCGLWKREVVKASTERATLGRVCFKLVIVMGLTWIVDVISWLCGGPNYIWYIPDILNSLQGVFIFIVVGCHPQVWAAVKRLWCFRDQQDTSNVVNHMSSCSQGLPSMNDTTTSKTADLSITKTVLPPEETLC